MFDGNWFEQKLRAKKLSQRKVAELLGVQESRVSRLLRGRVEMKLNEAAWFAANFGVPVEDVLRHAGGKARGSKKHSSKLRGKKAKPLEAKAIVDRDENPGSKECRHPLYGAMKGYITFVPGVDLTEPADPEWGELAWGDDTK